MRFVQVHLLTVHPPSNMNRDDTGRNKTAMFGGEERLRLSSQTKKRASRERFKLLPESDALPLGERGDRFAVKIAERLVADSHPAEASAAAAKAVLGLVTGKEKEKKTEDKAKPRGRGKKGAETAEAEAAPPGLSLESAALQFLSPVEIERAYAAAEKLVKDPDAKVEAEDILLRADTAVDIAMFGRTLTGNPVFNREAAVQVMHSFTVHASTVEDDYFTALSDHRTSAESGATHVGENAFGSGVFYSYFCVNRDLLIQNLAGDAALADRAIAELIRSFATVTPGGKRATFAAYSYASYVRVEKGDWQPRTLAGAFERAVTGTNIMPDAVARLRDYAAKIDQVYGIVTDSKDVFVDEVSLEPGAPKQPALADALAFVSA